MQVSDSSHAAPPMTQPARAVPTPFLDRLSLRHQQLVRHYVVDFSVERAAMACRYKTESARTILARLDVREAISELLKIDGGVTRSRIVEEIARIAFADPNDLMDVDERGQLHLRPFGETGVEARAAIASIKYKPGEYGDEREMKFHDKLGALTLLAKITGLTSEKPAANINIQTNVRTGVMIAPNVASEEEWEAEMRGDQARQAASDAKLIEAHA